MYKNKYALCALALLLTLLCPLTVSAAERSYMVVVPIVGVTKTPDVQYKVEDDSLVSVNDSDYDKLIGAAIYGNIVTVSVKDGADYGEVNDADGKRMGWIKVKDCLAPMPDYDAFAPEPFCFTAHISELFLLPGEQPISTLELGKYNVPMSPAAGEVTNGCGTAKSADGTEWTLLSFKSFGESGIGLRFAWTKSQNLLRLSSYKPNTKKVDEKMIPGSLREIGEVTDGVRRSVAKSGFAVENDAFLPEYVPFDDMADGYDSFTNVPKFLTADLFLHSFHRVFSNSLKNIERSVMAGKLEKMLNDSLARLDALEKKTHSEKLRPRFTFVRDFLTVPYLLLKPGAPIEASKVAAGEIARITEAKGVAVSSISGRDEDYTFYKPRGHYATDKVLARYFRAMAYLGGMPLLLEDKTKIAEIALVCELFSDPELTAQWNAIYDPIAYLVGDADDPSIREFGPIVQKALGGDLTKLSDEGVLGSLYEELKRSAPQPQIVDRKASAENMSREERVAEASGFRLMGRSFVLDAWAFSLLTSDPVSSTETPRNLPLAEDFMAVLGSKAADHVVDSERKKYAAYDEVLKKIKKDADGYFKAGSRNVYTDWLVALRTLFTEHKSQQFFFNSPLWDVKRLVTGLASWTELKHDTVLYAKQSYAEMGDAGGFYADPFEIPKQRGYVEPVPQTLGAIVNSLIRMGELIDKYGLRTNDYDVSAKLEALRECVVIYRDIAGKEVNGQPLSEEDFRNIDEVSSYVNTNLLLDSESSMVDENDPNAMKIALVTDVATDMLGGQVLHVGTGAPRRVFVFVDDKNGGPRLTVGFMSSFYEFPRSLGDGRMTDQEWKKKVYDPQGQQELEQLRPKWSEPLYVH